MYLVQMKSHALSHLCKSYQIEKESDTFMTRLDFYLQKKISEMAKHGESTVVCLRIQWELEK